jgi:hypothetical protein
MDPDLDQDADLDPDTFVSDLQDVNKQLLFFCLSPFEGTFTSFFEDNKSQNSRNQWFLAIFS